MLCFTEYQLTWLCLVFCANIERTIFFEKVSIIVNTLLFAGILGFLYIAMALYVIAGRIKYKISIGDGGNELMARRIRMHGNFAEYAPFGLMLLFLLDEAACSAVMVSVLGTMLVLGRIFHAIAFSRLKGPRFFRQIGMALTFISILAMSGLLIWMSVHETAIGHVS